MTLPLSAGIKSRAPSTPRLQTLPPSLVREHSLSSVVFLIRVVKHLPRNWSLRRLSSAGIPLDDDGDDDEDDEGDEDVPFFSTREIGSYGNRRY
ncbi:hypothetical protein AtEden1_Chr1g0019981 [Arabidopsis thaliana]